MPAPRLFRSLSFGGILCAGALMGSPACSGDPTFDDDGAGGSTGPCVIADKALCGVTCDNDNSCAAGLFCDPTHTCQAECIAGEASSPECNGAPCATNGRCTGNAGTGGTQTGTGGGGFNPPPGSGGFGGMGGGACIDVEVTPTPVIPNVVLLIDRSLSMTGESGYAARVQDAIDAGEYEPWECEGAVPGGPFNSEDAEFWRWNVVRTVLFNPTDGVVTELGNSVRFGLTTYSSDQSRYAECPTLVNVDLAFDNRDAMLEGFACSDLILETPTRESLAPTADALAALEVEGPKFIVLATDGAPDNCKCPNFSGQAPCNETGAQAAEMAAVVAEAARIHDDLGITVHVIDVSSPGQTAGGVALFDHLTEVATAGGGQSYDGTEPAGLIQAFRDIISDAQSCLIELNGMVVPGKESTGTVTLGGDELEYETDWVMPTTSQIELIDEACALFKTENPTLTIEFPCDTFVVK